MHDEKFSIYSTNKHQIASERKTGLKEGYARLYMYVTKDEYELPLVVATSLKDLSDAIGIKEKTLREELCRIRKGKYKGQIRTVDVPIEDSDIIP